MPEGRLGESAGKTSAVIRDGPRNEVHKAVTYVPRLCAILEVLPAMLVFSPHPRVCSLPQDSRWGKKKVGLFGSVSHSGGSWALTHMLSLSAVGEIAGQSAPFSTKPCHSVRMEIQIK